MSSHSELVRLAYEVGVAALQPPDRPDLWDTSHDANHLQRVMKTIVRLAGQLAVPPRRLEIALVGGALHDYADAKLLRPGETKEDALLKLDREFLSGLVDRGLLLKKEADSIREIVRRTGYSVMRRESKLPERPPSFLELDLVRDSDLLDSIGAHGVTRCIQFGATRNRPLRTSDVRLFSWEARPGNVEPDPFESDVLPGGTVEHFFEKLLRVGLVLATDPAKKIARPRTEFMKTYLRQLDCEEDGFA
jgi:uncharacterized protein